MILQVDQLNKNFFKSQLSLNFKLNCGDILVFLGNNGAGKTTSLRILAGILPTDSGQILLNAKPVFENLPDYQRQIGYAGENLDFNPQLLVKKFLKFTATLRQSSWQKADWQNPPWRLEQIIANFNLEKVLNKKIGELSRGYKQRLILAVSLIHQPKILILDEPTQGLDIEQKRQMWDILQNRQAQTIHIISTHDLSEAMQLATQVLIMADFTTLFYGTKEQLLQLALRHADNRQKLHPQLNSYLSAINNTRGKNAG